MQKVNSLAMMGAMMIGLVVAACSSSDTPPPTETPAPTCAPTIERFKSLMVVEDSVVGDARSSNAASGPWSFRYAFESLFPEGTDASAQVTSWLETWNTEKSLNGFRLDREPRGEGMNSALVCPWLRSTPSNECDDTCTTCKARTFDLAKAPYRLIAIVNRMDLRTRPDVPGPAGEGRLVFALTSGPADDPASLPLPMTVIFEYRLPDSKTPKQWAEAWQALGKHTDFGDAYKADLAAVVDEYVKRGASPERPYGSALAQVRTNESAFNWIWQLRQFTLNSQGRLALAALANTPNEGLNDSPTLRDYVTKNAEAIKKDQHVIPQYMLAGSSDVLLTRWKLTGVDEPTRLAFARGTCNGCHAGENPSIDTAFQVSPFRKGTEKLSAFLNRLDDPSADELAHREKLLAEVLCKSE